MVVAVAFLLNEDLASNLAQDSPHFAEMVSDFLTGLKLLIVHGHPPYFDFADFSALRLQLYQYVSAPFSVRVAPAMKAETITSLPSLTSRL